MGYMSNEQVEQIFDVHSTWLQRQLKDGKIGEREYQNEMRELERWAQRNSH